MSTKQKIIALLESYGPPGTWVPDGMIRSHCDGYHRGGSSAVTRVLRRLHEDGVIERPQQTFPGPRGPGWLGDFLATFDRTPGDFSAYAYIWAYRLVRPS